VQAPTDPRSELAALAARGITDWAVDRSRRVADPEHVRRAGVLVLFGVLDSMPADASGPVPLDLDVLLQRRSATLGHHPGEISFPGGGVEASDSDITATALREAVEETGLDPSGVDILGTLPELALPRSNNLVTPVLAWWARTSQVAAVDEREAVEVFRMPVADLLDPDNRASVQRSVGNRTFRIPAFEVDGVVVWGFTAIVLARIFDELGWSVPWDTTRLIEP
jgi:8-oxo-dGTP pyrophosphatase MutT (NUDIX family)